MARFIRKGVSKFHFLADVADTAAGPTLVEIAAGTDITDSIAAVAGFSLSNSEVQVPDMGSSFTKSIPGEDTAADSSLTFWEDDTADTIEALLPKGTEGFVYIQRKGGTGVKPKSCDLFQVRVSSKSPSYTTDNEGAQFMVQFTQTEAPTLDKGIPTV